MAHTQTPTAPATSTSHHGPPHQSVSAQKPPPSQASNGSRRAGRRRYTVSDGRTIPQHSQSNEEYQQPQRSNNNNNNNNNNHHQQHSTRRAYGNGVDFTHHAHPPASKRHLPALHAQNAKGGYFQQNPRGGGGPNGNNTPNGKSQGGYTSNGNGHNFQRSQALPAAGRRGRRRSSLAVDVGISDLLLTTTTNANDYGRHAGGSKTPLGGAKQAVTRGGGTGNSNNSGAPQPLTSDPQQQQHSPENSSTIRALFGDNFQPPAVVVDPLGSGNLVSASPGPLSAARIRSQLTQSLQARAAANGTGSTTPARTHSVSTNLPSRTELETSSTANGPPQAKPPVRSNSTSQEVLREKSRKLLSLLTESPPPATAKSIQGSGGNNAHRQNAPPPSTSSTVSNGGNGSGLLPSSDLSPGPVANLSSLFSKLISSSPQSPRSGGEHPATKSGSSSPTSTVAATPERSPRTTTTTTGKASQQTNGQRLPLGNNNNPTTPNNHSTPAKGTATPQRTPRQLASASAKAGPKANRRYPKANSPDSANDVFGQSPAAPRRTPNRKASPPVGMVMVPSPRMNTGREGTSSSSHRTPKPAAAVVPSHQPKGNVNLKVSG
ncbi:hypothetical protein BJ085DRAFT_37302 [Dimargaris cristalligena]|uniref:Uncharacterized protein n=1 Tax=Dimargaris cristalligena TaxID=215637 RepID=A0A4P9ZVG6_9FUNG|nr:hypothetical protein BJ085DRAFT_37302 [Dimargaris cristalligena]|eukprot:RKP36620.1 hypothetical protein BJ085DRAFT_37302 [Dimargaris cristalligena]